MWRYQNAGQHPGIGRVGLIFVHLERMCPTNGTRERRPAKMTRVLGDGPLRSLNGKIRAIRKGDFTKSAIFSVALLAIAGSAFAQPLSGPSNYDVKNMSFDTWCQETRQYSADRCHARRPDDVKVFEDYRSVIERYELEYLKRGQQNEELRADINRDPMQTVQGLQHASPYPDFRRSRNGW